MAQNKDPKEVLREVLAIINYQDDKEKFINDFLEIAGANGLDSLIKSLPQDQQTTLQNADEEGTISILKSNFTQEQLKQALTEALEKTTEDYIETVEPTLSEEQKQKLQELASSLQ